MMSTTSDPSNILQQLLSDGVLTLTLNRPERLNALTPPLMRRLRNAVQEAATDPRVRVVVLAGSGRAFCTGGDIKDGRKDPELPKELKSSDTQSAEFRYDQLRGFAETAALLDRMPKPSISMVRGPVVGAGLGLALCCDFRMFSETVTIQPAFARNGLSGDFGGSYFLSRLVGLPRAQEIFLLDEKLDIEAIRSLCLATRIVKDDELLAETESLARRLATGPAIAYRAIKENFRGAESNDIVASLDVEMRNMVRCSLTADHREAISAFVEKRPAIFNGR